MVIVSTLPVKIREEIEVLATSDVGALVGALIYETIESHVTPLAIVEELDRIARSLSAEAAYIRTTLIESFTQLAREGK